MTVEKVRPRCFLDIEIDGQNVGRIIIELFADICPLTCENFRALCTGEKGVGKTTNKPLHYKGVPFHRIVKNFIIQSGDFVSGNGTGGESIYGGTFKDENFEIKHDKSYLLSMANKGKDTNGSQFFITTQPAPHLDGKHTVFGHVISGQQIVLEIENQKTTNSRPLKDVVIANCGELVLKVKQKAKKARSVSESSSSAVEDEKSRSKRKKKTKKQEKKSKREKKEKPSLREETVSKYEDSFDCSVDPDEIPEVPANNFLMRRSPVREGNRNFSRAPGRQGGFVFARKPALSRSGRKIKGRGLMRYRTPSSSGGSRSGSETPPHWRQAQARVVPLDKVISKISNVDRSRSATPEEEFEKDLRQKTDGLPLRQRLGPYRKVGDEKGEDDNYNEYRMRSVSSDVRRSRDLRQRRESPRWKNDRSSGYKRRDSASEEESDTSPENRSRNQSFRSMVVKADSEKHGRSEEKDQRAKRSPFVRRDRQRSPDRGQQRVDERVERPSRNQNIERDRGRERSQRDNTSANNAARCRQDSEKDERRHNKEPNSRRSPKKSDRNSSRKSPLPKHKPSASSDSDSDKRRRRRKDSQAGERDSKKIHSNLASSRRHADDKHSLGFKKGATESLRCQDGDEKSNTRDQRAVTTDKFESKEVILGRKSGKIIEKELGISSSLRRTLLAYAGELSPSSESEEEEKITKTKKTADNQSESIGKSELVIPSEGKHFVTENRESLSNDVKIKCDIEPSETHLTETSVSDRSKDSPFMPMEVDSVSPPFQKSEMDAGDSVGSASNEIVEEIPSVRSASPQAEVVVPEKQESFETLENDDEVPENLIVDKSAQQDAFEQNSIEPMEIDEIGTTADQGVAVPESSSSSLIEESEALVSSSVENDRLISREQKESTSHRTKHIVDYASIPFPLDVIPLPEETPSFIPSRTDQGQLGIGRKSVFSSSKERKTSTDSYEKVYSGIQEKRIPISPRDDRSRSRSDSSSRDHRSLRKEESSGEENSRGSVERHQVHKSKERDVFGGRAQKSFAVKSRDEDDNKTVAQHVNVTMIPSVLRHSILAKVKSEKSSDPEDTLNPAEKSDSDADEHVAPKSRRDKRTSSRSSSHSSVEHKAKPSSSNKSGSFERRPSPTHHRKFSPSFHRKSPQRRSSGSPPSRRSRSPMDRRSRSPIRPRRSPAGRRRSSTPPPRRSYRKSRSPLKSKSPVRRRSRSSSHSPSARRSRSRSRSPVRRRYSRTPERRYYRRSWSRPYDGRSRFSRYPRPRNRSPDRSYSRPYSRDSGRERPSRRTSRSRSRSRSDIDQRRKRRGNRSSSSASSSRTSSSLSGDKKQSRKKSSKKKQRSSSSSSSSRSSSP